MDSRTLVVLTAALGAATAASGLSRPLPTPPSSAVAAHRGNGTRRRDRAGSWPGADRRRHADWLPRPVALIAVNFGLPLRVLNVDTFISRW